MMSIGGIVNKFNKSMVGYLPIKVLEGIIGIVTLKVYTSLFLPEVYGQFTLINTAISITFIIFLGWIVQSVVRYSDAYAKDNEKNVTFFSTLLFTWLFIVLILSLLFVVATYGWPNVMGNPTLELRLLTVFVLISFSVNQIMLTFLLYSNQRVLNSILLLLAAVLKLGMTYLITRFIGNNIMAIFVSQSVTDMAIGLVAIKLSNTKPKISIKAYSIKMLTRLIAFGYPLIGMGLTMAVLNMSDRYIIKFFYNDEAVGIYTSNYSVASAAFTMLMMGLSRGIYPKVLEAWNKKDHKAVEKALSMGVKYYILFGLPAAIGLMLLSKPIASIVVGVKYFEGYPVIGFVAFGMFFFGLSEYANKGWELTANTFPILVNCMIAAICNIVLNIVFIPIVGYIFASYSTLLSFMIYYFVSWLRQNKSIKFVLYKKNIWNILISSTIMSIIVLVFDYFVLIKLSNLFVVIIFAMGGYFVSLYLLGEIKEEVKRII